MLQIKFPVTLHDLTKPVNEFYSLSADGIMNGCVGDLDGWLARSVFHWKMKLKSEIILFWPLPMLWT
jgi:hypothetical protein